MSAEGRSQSWGVALPVGFRVAVPGTPSRSYMYSKEFAGRLLVRAPV